MNLNKAAQEFLESCDEYIKRKGPSKAAIVRNEKNGWRIYLTVEDNTLFENPDALCTTQTKEDAFKLAVLFFKRKDNYDTIKDFLYDHSALWVSMSTKGETLIGV
jgi:hypothetical protein